MTAVALMDSGAMIGAAHGSKRMHLAFWCNAAIARSARRTCLLAELRAAVMV